MKFIHSLVVVALGVPILRADSDSINMVSQIVGTSWQVVSQGVSHVHVDFDTVGLFPTLGGVLKFDPPDGVVGDSVEFDLDGHRQVYKIVALDGERYRLHSDQKCGANNITFEGVPLLDEFTFIHRGTNTVTLSTSGELSPAKMREIGERPLKARPKKLDVRYVCPLDGREYEVR
ncbi:MAG: hypothetical protein ACI4QG_04870 [Candidatus Cryptobacteroides sp.]